MNVQQCYTTHTTHTPTHITPITHNTHTSHAHTNKSYRERFNVNYLSLNNIMCHMQGEKHGFI